MTAPLGDKMITDRTGRTLIYDAFVRDGWLYLISSYMYANEPPLTIEIAGGTVIEVGRNEHEPVRFFKCDIRNMVEVPMSITINGHTYPLRLSPVTPWKGGFAVATLFMHDAPYIGNMIAWYRAHGCVAFYLYYNGKQLPAGLPTGPDIEYFLWPYRYFNREKVFGRPDAWLHAAQPAFLTAARFKHMPAHDWIAYIDVDEHVWPESGEKLADVLAAIPMTTGNIVRVPCHWAVRHDTGVSYSESGDWSRGKLIYRGTYDGLCEVHMPKPSATGVMIDRPDLKMLHCVNYGHLSRLSKVIAPLSEVPWPVGEKVDCLCWQRPGGDDDEVCQEC